MALELGRILVMVVGHEHDEEAIERLMQEMTDRVREVADKLAEESGLKLRVICEER